MNNVHYFLSMDNGETVHIELNQQESKIFDTKVVKDIAEGRGMIQDHNAFGKTYILRHVVTIFPINDDEYQELLKKKDEEIKKYKTGSIGFRMNEYQGNKD